MPQLRAFAQIDPSARVIWVGPRVEPHIGLNFVLNGGCDHGYALREGQAELFTELDRQLAAAAGGRRRQLPVAGRRGRVRHGEDFMTCD